MKDFLNIIVQLCIIGLVQSVAEVFFDNNKEYMKKLISMLCIGVSFYIVLNYIYAKIMKEIIYIFNIFI